MNIVSALLEHLDMDIYSAQMPTGHYNKAVWETLF